MHFYLSSSSFARQIRHIIDGIASTDGFDTSDDTFSISLAAEAALGMTGGILDGGRMHFGFNLLS